MATRLPTSYTKSRTHVFEVRDYRKNAVEFFFRGHSWKLTVRRTRDDDYVTSRVRATPRTRLRKYAQTIPKAKVSIEILEHGSGKPVVFQNHLVQRHIKVLSYKRRPFFDFDWESYEMLEETVHVKRRELEMSACVHDNSFTFRCTVSEDDVPLGIFSRLRSRVSGIFSKPSRQGYVRIN